MKLVVVAGAVPAHVGSHVSWAVERHFDRAECLLARTIRPHVRTGLGIGLADRLGPICYFFVTVRLGSGGL